MYRSSSAACLMSNLDFSSTWQTVIDDEDIDHDLLQQQCSDFATAYEGDVNAQLHAISSKKFWTVVCCTCHKRLQSSGDIKFSKPQTPEQLLEAAVQYGKDVFPNLRTALQIVLTVAVSVASCEPSFSKLKFIKTYLRSTMKLTREAQRPCHLLNREGDVRFY
jgi:hypothetical protein